MLVCAVKEERSPHQELQVAVIVLQALGAAAVKAHAHHAAPALINPTAGNRAAVCVVLVRSAAALVRLHVRLVLLGRFKD